MCWAVWAKDVEGLGLEIPFPRPLIWGFQPYNWSNLDIMGGSGDGLSTKNVHFWFRLELVGHFSRNPIPFSPSKSSVLNEGHIREYRFMASPRHI